jgi:putative membrane protein
MQRSAKDYIALLFKGIAMGAADVVPGVSGGTIAFISGIYEELLGSIKSINVENLKILLKGDIAAFWTKINGWFLLVLFGGVGISVVSLAKIITHLLATYPQLIWGFFFGLIIASILFIGKSITKFNAQSIISMVIGTGVAYWITVIEPSQLDTPIWFVFVAGAIAICAMILPGISGSFILLLMGMYSYILTSIKDLNILVLGVFAAGCVTGLLGFSRVLSWLLSKYNDIALAVLTGFMIGSLNKVWPWKITTKYRTNSHGDEVPFLQENISPMDYEGDSQLIMVIGLSIVGFLVIFLMEKFAKKNEVD